MGEITEYSGEVKTRWVDSEATAREEGQAEWPNGQPTTSEATV